MKISKQTILIGISTLVVAGGTIAYLLLSKDDPSVLGWISSSWLYRKGITVANGGGDLFSEDVLIEVDTASLISASKLQSDCDDLRFTDGDETTSIYYWIEGGCNTSTTQIWVQIPELRTGGQTIYMYYGNASATNSEESWGGEFLFLNNTSCPTGWTRKTEYDGKYAYGASSFGTEGGSATHNNGTASCTTGGPNTGAQNTQSDSGGTTASPGHTHTNAMVSIDNVSNTPPYLDMVYCANPDLNIASGLITLFTSTPSGWTRFSALDNKFARGASTYGGTGGAATHTHTTTGGYTTGSSGSSTDTPGSSVGAGPHTHTTINGTTGSANSLPPYRDMIYASKNTSGYASADLISMTTASPPLGWGRVAYIDAKFPRGATTFGGYGGSTTHTHSLTITTNTGPSGASSDGSRVASAATTNHYHTCTATSASGSEVPAYIETLFYQRKTSLTSTLGSEEVGNTAPSAPSSLLTESSTNPTQVTDLTPEFSAVFSDTETPDTGNYYQIQVNTNNTFTGTVMWDSTKTAFSPVVSNGARSQDISYAGTTLSLNGDVYYWRIKFWDNHDTQNESSWSSVAQFTMGTTPNTPSSLQTEGANNPTKVTDITPEFSAVFSDPDTPDTGNYYQIQVNTNNTFTGTVMWDSTKTALSPVVVNGARSQDISYAGTTLSFNGTTYYWKITFWDNSNSQGQWSATAQFTMDGNPLAPTTLLTGGETNPTRIISLTPYFSAIYSDPNGDIGSSYEIEINTNNSFSGTVMWDTGQLSTSVNNNARSPNYTYAGTVLTNSNTTYYWRIRFWDSDNHVGEWSSTAQFSSLQTSFLFEGLQLGGLKLN